MKKGQIIAIIGIVLGLVITAITISVVIKINDSKVYQITFETNGGSKIEEQEVKEGEKINKPADPIKEGFNFIEWIYNGKTYDFSTSVNSDMVLKANWQEKNDEQETFVIRFNSDGGTTIANQIIEKGRFIEKPADPIKEGYKFGGWYLNETLFNFDEAVASDIELTAIWEKIKTSKNKKEENKQNLATNKTDQSVSSNNQSNNSGNTGNGNNSSTEKKLPTPKITKASMGGLVDDKGTVGEYLELDKVEGSVEIYYATSEKGEYKLLRTATKPDEGKNLYEVTIPLGKHYYFKVRLTANDEYSEYSNIIDYDNSN